MDSLELIINLLIIVLLVPTIIYAYKLNKNLTLLRENQNSLARLVSSLNDATVKAENSIPKLKDVTEVSSQNLLNVVDNAKSLKEDLTFINERADNLADRLENVIHDGRNLKNSSSFDTEEAQQKQSQDKSQAELELLKALRSIK
ncbi:MAG: hypothetical protein IJ660_03905 [Alphaproteobacteria bacterium]|nr:hypothetical protein [Alphaproteobacteria bacterium]